MASRRWNNFNKTLVYFTVLISAVSNIPLFMKPEEHYDIIDAVVSIITIFRTALPESLFHVEQH